MYSINIAQICKRFLEVAASRHMVILSLSPVKNRLGSGISVSNSVKSLVV